MCDGIEGITAIKVSTQTETAASDVATQIDASTQTNNNWGFRGIRQYNSNGWHTWDGERWSKTGERL